MFRLQQAGLYHRNIAAEHLFAPAAELLLASIAARPLQGRVLLLEPGAPLLFRTAALSPELVGADVYCVNLDASKDAASLAATAIPLPWVCAKWSALPFADASFDAVISNLLLGDVEADADSS